MPIPLTAGDGGAGSIRGCAVSRQALRSCCTGLLQQPRVRSSCRRGIPPPQSARGVQHRGHARFTGAGAYGWSALLGPCDVAAAMSPGAGMSGRSGRWAEAGGAWRSRTPCWRGGCTRARAHARLRAALAWSRGARSGAGLQRRVDHPTGAAVAEGACAEPAGATASCSGERLGPLAATACGARRCLGAEHKSCLQDAGFRCCDAGSGRHASWKDRCRQARARGRWLQPGVSPRGAQGLASSRGSSARKPASAGDSVLAAQSATSSAADATDRRPCGTNGMCRKYRCNALSRPATQAAAGCAGHVLHRARGPRCRFAAERSGSLSERARGQAPVVARLHRGPRRGSCGKHPCR